MPARSIRSLRAAHRAVRRGTKFAGPLLDADKEYLATLELGSRTSTGDAEGEVIERKPVASPGRAGEGAERFRGEIEQVPPMHSALKHKGTPLYRLARRGEKSTRAARRVRISLEVLRFEVPLLVMRVVRSKGHLHPRARRGHRGGARLRRASLGLAPHRLGAFSRRGRADLDALEALPTPERRASLAACSTWQGLPRAELGAAEEARLRQGQAPDQRARARSVRGRAPRRRCDRARHGRRRRRLEAAAAHPNG